MLKPVFAASASSCSPPATPPSVGSCIAVTPPVLKAVSASFTTLIFVKKFSAFSTKLSSKTFSSCVFRSDAKIAVPSIPVPLVRIILLPFFAPLQVTYFPFSAMPMAHPVTMGCSMPGVTSQCPPTMAMPSCFAALSICVQIFSTSLGVEFLGSSMMELNHLGCTPRVAMSFALTWTASHPSHSSAPVIGSDEIARYVFSALTMAASSPIEELNTTSFLLAPKFLNTIFSKISVGTLPGNKPINKHQHKLTTSKATKKALTSHH